ncbi:MAG: SOS response-associated peptidase family protein [Caldimonas sp.]
MSSNYLAPTSSELEREWGLTIDDDWACDIAGGDFAPIIRRFGIGAAAQKEAVLARFGLLPASAKAEKAPGSTVNARAETAATRSNFKAAWAQRQWCIVPAQCLYVPLYADGAKRSERWRIRRVDRTPLSVAGLWDRWVNDEGRAIVSFAMLTINCDLHPLLARFNRATNDKGEPAEKRTPVLLAEEDFDAWLDTTPSRAPIFCGTFGKDDLDAEPAPTTSRRSNTALTPLDSVVSEL